MDKHGSQLGHYRLIRVQGGRPIYQHVDTEAQFLYYHPYSGGNWLINSEVGLLYGGIQNSKDSPLCPYLINTVSSVILRFYYSCKCFSTLESRMMLIVARRYNSDMNKSCLMMLG